MMKSSLRGCPVCAGTSCETLRVQRFVLPDGHPLADGYAVVCCESCGSVYADVPAKQEDYDRFYARLSKYEDGGTSSGAGDLAWDRQRLSETAARIAAFVPDRQARILDMGCANGGLLNCLWDLGYTNLVGLDPSAACVHHTQTLHGIAAFVGSLSTIPQHLGQFDMLLLSHVLEHVLDLQGAVRGIGQRTKTGALVYVEVPDACRYVDFVTSPFQDFNTEHINHFSQRSLRNLLEPLGWKAQAEGQSVSLCSADTQYPAVYACYLRTDSAVTPAVTRDSSLCPCIRAYIERSESMMLRLKTRLHDALQGASTVIMWGTGQLTMKLLAESCFDNVRISVFVDSNPINHGKSLLGIPIVAPSSIVGMDLPIVIGSVIHQKEIADTVRGTLHLQNRIITLEPEWE
jgi:SAM-dependent methyltransferase